MRHRVHGGIVSVVHHCVGLPCGTKQGLQLIACKGEGDRTQFGHLYTESRRGLIDSACNFHSDCIVGKKN